jgi:hypothetical protein
VGADGAVATDLFPVSTNAAVFDGPAAAAFGWVDFSTTGVVAATSAVNAAPIVGDASVCVPGCFAGAAGSATATGTVVFTAVVTAVVTGPAVAAAFAIATVAVASTTGPGTTGPELFLVCVDGAVGVAAGGAVGAVLAAMAATAIASGGVALPVGDGGVAGVAVGAMATGIATAIGFGVVTTAPICCASVTESVAEVVSEAGLLSAWAGSVFEAPGFAVDPELAALLASGPAALAPEAGWASAARLSETVFGL